MTDLGTCTVSGGGFSTTLYLTSLSHGIDKQIKEQPIPNDPSGDILTWIVDLRMIKEAVTITGYLLDSIASGQLTQKQQLIQLVRNTTTTLTLTWGDAGTFETMRGQIKKIDIKEEPVRLLDSANSLNGTITKSYNVQLVFIQGTAKSVYAQ